ncbi:MAG TPA: STY4526/YPO1902 family pathogenicity island replication protein [Candidatus Competibacteraceae bacterium]|nr:STY4526/YPO1902 family pathogenicity island replication protein [Candidatus Competibacteraceae bacterium]
MSDIRWYLVQEALSRLVEKCFSADEQWQFQDLTLEELDRLKRMSPSFLSVTFNQERFLKAKAHVHRQIRLEHHLLRAGAPFAMMRHFYGVSWEEFTRRRKALGLQGDGIGRPTAPTEEAIRTIWQAWQQESRQVPGTPVSPEHYLAIHQVTGFPLRLIWTLVQQWSCENHVLPAALALVPRSPPPLDTPVGSASADAQRT